MIEPGPSTPIGQQIHAEKHREPGETFREGMNRVASALQDSPAHYHAFRDVLLSMRFLPGGRVQTAMGASKSVTAYNCFVSGTIEDSFVEGEGSIMGRAHEAAATLRLGGGIGYDFSPLRPEGALIRKLMSSATGPISFMRVYDAICATVRSTSHRRGAQMGVLRVDHPDIVQFVHIKNDLAQLTNFNLSIAITDEFMECLAAGKPFALRHGGQVYREVDPASLWERIMRSTWDYAEPGVLFIDAINRDNNLRYCETIAATNPCGEQPLPPYGACLLGSFNLTRYMRREGSNWFFDWDQLGDDIPHVVRAMDNVVDRTIYPLPQQRQEALNKRRMGLGITGLANAAEAMGMRYGSPMFLNFERQVMDRIARDCYRASALLAKEKGPFPLFDRDKFMQNGEGWGNLTFFNRFLLDKGGDADLRRLVYDHGLRNSHLLSVAPTGTISLAADNISSGIEPPFLLEYERTMNLSSGPRREVVQDYGKRVFGIDGKTTKDVTIQEHVDVLITAARRVDSAVSKTINMDNSCSWEDFKGIYEQVWQAGGKGCTTFNKDGKRFGVLNEITQPENEGLSCTIDENGRRDCG